MSQAVERRGQQITSYLPEDLPDQLREVLRTSGLGDRMIQGARLLVNGHIVPQWSMEFSVDLSVEEGKTIFSMLVPHQMAQDPAASAQWYERSGSGRLVCCDVYITPCC